MKTYDYVVVGGGSSGCIAAAELAKVRGQTVLLLECGGEAEANPETLGIQFWVGGRNQPRATCYRRTPVSSLTARDHTLSSHEAHPPSCYGADCFPGLCSGVGALCFGD